MELTNCEPTSPTRMVFISRALDQGKDLKSAWKSWNGNPLGEARIISPAKAQAALLFRREKDSSPSGPGSERSAEPARQHSPTEVLVARCGREFRGRSSRLLSLRQHGEFVRPCRLPPNDAPRPHCHRARVLLGALSTARRSTPRDCCPPRGFHEPKGST